MKNSALGIAFLAVTVCLTGCKETIEDNDTPFSFVGIHLGMTKDDAKDRIRFCISKSPTEAQCFLGNDDTQLSFFGTKTQSETVALFEPYTQISAISLYYEGKAPSKYSIERQWDLGNRCVDGYDVERIARVSDDLALNVAVRGLHEIRILPGKSGFICVAKDGRFIKVTNHGNSGSVEMHFLQGTVADLVEKIYTAEERAKQIEQKQKEAIGLTD